MKYPQIMLACCTLLRVPFTNCSHDFIKEQFDILDYIKTGSSSVYRRDSYFVSEGPGSLLKSGGNHCLDQSLFRDHMETVDPALCLWKQHMFKHH